MSQKTKTAQATEKNLFFMCYDESKALKIAQNGFECGDEEESFLGKYFFIQLKLTIILQNEIFLFFTNKGNSLTGIHFGKHLDVMLRYEYSKKNRVKELYCVITKVKFFFLLPKQYFFRCQLEEINLFIFKAFYDPTKLKQLNPYKTDNQKINGDSDFNGHVAFLKQKLVNNINRVITALYKESAVSKQKNQYFSKIDYFEGDSF